MLWGKNQSALHDTYCHLTVIWQELCSIAKDLKQISFQSLGKNWSLQKHQHVQIQRDLTGLTKGLLVSQPWMDPSYEKIQYKIKTLVENTNDTTDEVLINSTVLYVQVLLLCSVGGAVASWLKCSTPEKRSRFRALAEDIVLCSWTKHFTLMVPLSTQVYKWVLFFLPFKSWRILL